MSRYWVLKTTDNGDIDPMTGKPPRKHWRNFYSEQVVAIGWVLSPALYQRRGNLNNITPTEWIADLIGYTCTDGTDEDREAQARTACPKILKFINEMSTGEGVFLCQGYPANQEKDVHVYGFAKIRGSAYYDEHPTWGWCIKRQACIWAVEREVPVVSLREMLNKGALLQTVHEISETSFHEVCRLLDFSYPDTAHG